MAVYFVDGRGLGSGKTLCTVGRIQEYLKAGRKVATNLDLYLEHMMPLDSKATVTRLPDKPRAIDLENLGMGDDKTSDEYDENTFGAIVLDECGTWLHSRDWADKDRRALFNWFVHARKLHWDIYLIIQDAEQLDKSIRGALCDFHVRCANTNKIPVPFVGAILRVAGIHGLPWKGHVARVNYGMGQDAMFHDRWWYLGKRLHQAYRTGQQFRDQVMFTDDGEVIDMRASYTTLSAWHMKGRYEPPQPDFRAKLLKWAAIAVAFPICMIVQALGNDPIETILSMGIMRKPQRR